VSFSAAAGGGLQRRADPAVVGRVERDARRDDLVDAVEHVVGELDVGGGELGVEVLHGAGPDDGCGHGRMAQHEGDGQLDEADPGLLGELGKPVGEEQFCVHGNVGTYAGIDKDGRPTQGGYSQGIVVTERFVVRIPDALGLDVAAPLLCAGITTYSPLNHWKAGPGRRVAVVGLGGLGHVAVKIAHAMGAEVTVLSQSLKKQEDGLRLGADAYYATSDPETFSRLASSFDLIINTVSAPIDVDAYLSLLAVDGTLVNVGAPEKPLSLHVFSLLLSRRSYAGSPIGGIRETQEMLDFCAEHGIGAEIETIPADKINEAYDRVVASDVRYRFVIDAATFA
jgi:uncharacterized zinc-type alcohol dehydrogenase-like protein